MTHSKIQSRLALTLETLVIVILFLVSAAGSRAAEEENAADQGGRVIYNLDCNEFFVGTFGPVVPETIDQWVDHHAALGITDLFVNGNAQRTN